MTQSGLGGNPFDGPIGFDPFPHEPPPVGSRPPSTEANALATLSVVFAVVFAPAGAILGHLALGQIAAAGQRGRGRALTGLTLSYVVITALVVSLVVWAAGGDDEAADVGATSMPTIAPSPSARPAPPPPPPPPRVDAAGLPGVLIPLPDLRTLIGDPGQMELGITETVEPPKDAGSFVDESCLPSFIGGTPQAFDATNWRLYRGDDTRNRQTAMQVGQSAALFDDASAAQGALEQYVAKWKSCAGRTIIWTTSRGDTVVLPLGAPRDAGGGITVLDDQVPSANGIVHTVRTLAVKQNVLIDNTVTGREISDVPVVVTQAMLDRIPT